MATGIPEAMATRNTLAANVVGSTKNRHGIHAVAGTGPISLSNGMPQYANRRDQPKATPAKKPTTTPEPKP